VWRSRQSKVPRAGVRSPHPAVGGRRLGSVLGTHGGSEVEPRAAGLDPLRFRVSRLTFYARSPGGFAHVRRDTTAHGTGLAPPGQGGHAGLRQASATHPRPARWRPR
jgi:hypothetical protein